MKPLLAGLLLVITASSAAAQVPSGWVSYTAPEERYRAAFPATPAIQSVVDTNSTGRGTSIRITAVEVEGAAFMIADMDFPPGTEPSLQGLRESMLAAGHGVLVSESGTVLQGIPGLDVTATVTNEGVNFRVRLRIYILNQRAYAIQTIIPQDAPDQAEQTFKFFEAFSIHPAGGLPGQ